MGGLIGGSPAAVAAVAAVAVPGAATAALAGTALFLARQHGRYGRIAGWQGQVALAALASGLGLAAYALWPLPAGVDGLCAITGGAPFVPAPLGTLTPFDGSAALHAGLALAVFVPVGALAQHRSRRRWLFTAGLGALLALAVEAVQYTGLLGLYPCAYRTAALDDVVLGTAGALLGWGLARALVRVLPRGWPAAVPDLMPPALSRRVLGHALDAGLCWFGASTVAAVLAAVPATRWADPAQVRPVALVVLAVLFGLVVPLLRRDRGAPGRAAAHLGIGALGRPGPAARPRVALRHILLYGPVLALVLLGLPWWTLAVAALHGCTIVVRRDRAGLLDLVAGTRVTTRTAIAGGLPRRMVRYAPPREPAVAVR